MANQLSLANVVNISVAAAQAGVGSYNTSNLALFTSELFNPATFGSDGYKIYLSPSEVADDFGSTSDTYKMANSVFSQQPNILAGNGYLVIIPMLWSMQKITFDGVAASGSFDLTLPEGTITVNWNDSAATIQTALQSLTGLSNLIVSGSIAGQELTITFVGYYGPTTLISLSNDTLQDSMSAPVIPTASMFLVGETVEDAVLRTEDLVQYFGVMSNQVLSQSDEIGLAGAVQPLNKIAFVVSRTEADIEVGGKIDLLRSGGYTHTRGLFYGADNDTDAFVMMASYAGRALSVNFAGSNTTTTMHLKDLTGVQPDPMLTQTMLVKAQNAGADVYVSLQGVAKVFCSGENSFFDQVYNLQWLIGALQVAGFNYLAQSSTKVPQTESGMDGLKKAYRDVCEQAITNQYIAGGAWNSSTTFGNQADFLANITQRGYYIYSSPVAKQLQADREARIAPLVQIAIKEAGAIHSSNVVVYVNA
jgi:hypothetical protein